MDRTFSRRTALKYFAALTGAAVAWPRRTTAQPGTPIAVYKDPSCGCCGAWVEYLKANGFAPTVTNATNMDTIKARYNVPGKLQSCHTAVVSGLVVEGHVPVADIRQLLAQKPKGIIGITIPGMPASAPGMDGKPFQPYTVLAFDARGTTTTFAAHTRA